MAKEVDMSLFSVLEPFRRVINSDPPNVSASTKLNFSDCSSQSLKDSSNQSIKEGIVDDFLYFIRYLKALNSICTAIRFVNRYF